MPPRPGQHPGDPNPSKAWAAIGAAGSNSIASNKPLAISFIVKPPPVSHDCHLDCIGSRGVYTACRSKLDELACGKSRFRLLARPRTQTRRGEFVWQPSPGHQNILIPGAGCCYLSDMRCGYLDAFSGISGDMTVGALL